MSYENLGFSLGQQIVFFPQTPPSCTKYDIIFWNTKRIPAGYYSVENVCDSRRQYNKTQGFLLCGSSACSLKVSQRFKLLPSNESQYIRPSRANLYLVLRGFRKCIEFPQFRSLLFLPTCKNIFSVSHIFSKILRILFSAFKTINICW